jgi:hypothetical protein
MAAPTLTSPPEDIKELVRLCRTGRLHDVEKWIASGKPVAGTVGKRKTLIQIAVETGFHSLVELIARHEQSQALADSLSLRRPDLVKLLLENGARITAVPRHFALRVT